MAQDVPLTEGLGIGLIDIQLLRLQLADCSANGYLSRRKVEAWDMSTPLPHDRDAAVQSVTGDSPKLIAFNLEPLSIRVYEGSVGVVHYRYQATVEPPDGNPMRVTGSWTEVYMKQENRWLMVAVSGRPASDGGTNVSAAA